MQGVSLTLWKAKYGAMPLHHENRKPNNLTSPIAPVRRCLTLEIPPRKTKTRSTTNCCWKVITRATAMWNVALSLLAVARKCSTIKFCPHARAVPFPCTVHVTHTQQTADSTFSKPMSAGVCLSSTERSCHLLLFRFHSSECWHIPVYVPSRPNDISRCRWCDFLPGQRFRIFSQDIN